MGSFDILNYPIKCPKCFKKREWKLQIKTFVKESRWIDDYPFIHNIGDEVIVDDDIIMGIGNCPNCMSQKDVNVKIINGKISGDYELQRTN